LVHELARHLCEIVGCSDVAVVESPNIYEQFYRNRSVHKVAEYFGFSSAFYRIADLSEEQMSHRYGRGLAQYTIGRTWAEAALQADSSVANAHFALALVLGRLSRTRGGKERVRFAKIIYDETVRTIQMDPKHDGAYHILGMWNAEVKRLSGLTRFVAKTFLGAGFMNRASWDSARVYMERAVQLNPQHVYHRLELAGVYLDVDSTAKATEQLQAIASLPDGDPMDPYYKRLAAAALADIEHGNADDADDRLRKG